MLVFFGLVGQSSPLVNLIAHTASSWVLQKQRVAENALEAKGMAEGVLVDEG